jgi:hypothetical protein
VVPIHSEVNRLEHFSRGLLESNRIDLDDDPICLTLHLICPEVQFPGSGQRERAPA